MCQLAFADNVEKSILNQESLKEWIKSITISLTAIKPLSE